MPTFSHYRQNDAMDCGPTCLRMVAKYYGKNYSIDRLRTQAEYSKEVVSLLGIALAAEAIGFKSTGVQLSYKQLMEDATLSAVLHWGQNHFVVLVLVVQKMYYYFLMLLDKSLKSFAEIEICNVPLLYWLIITFWLLVALLQRGKPSNVFISSFKALAIMDNEFNII